MTLILVMIAMAFALFLWLHFQDKTLILKNKGRSVLLLIDLSQTSNTNQIGPEGETSLRPSISKPKINSTIPNELIGQVSNKTEEIKTRIRQAPERKWSDEGNKGDFDFDKTPLKPKFFPNRQEKNEIDGLNRAQRKIKNDTSIRNPKLPKNATSNKADTARFTKRKINPGVQGEALVGLYKFQNPSITRLRIGRALPKMPLNSSPPLKAFARPYTFSNRPQIAIVVGSLGLSEAPTMAAIQQLPGNVTLAFAPYGRNLQYYVNLARAAGHEILLQIPMEPFDYPAENLGGHTLLTSLSEIQNIRRLNWFLERFTGYVGLVNFMGDHFISADTHLKPILRTIQARGLMFIDKSASLSDNSIQLAGQIGLPIVKNDKIIDAKASRAAIDAQLLEIEHLASINGSATGFGFPYPVTIERLALWSRKITDRGYDLVPISALSIN